MNSENAPSIIISIVVLTMLIAGIISRKDIALRQVFKYCILWLILGLFVIALYSYRFEFSDFKQRMMSSINPSKPILDKENKQIIIKISDDGHYYLQALVNGQKITFMIDTGASSVAISQDDAKTIGIDTKKLNYNQRYQTANGISFGASVNLESIDIDGYKISNVKASVTPNLVGASLFGMSALKKFSSYQFSQDTLTLYLP